jgi:hypothetical protein
VKRYPLVLLIFTLLLPTADLLAQDRMNKPNDFTIEGLGKCALYSLSYQRMVSPQIGLEVGASAIGGATSGAGGGVFFLTAGPRFYFTKNNASPFITAGAVYITAGSQAGFLEGGGSTVYAYAAPGFEYRSPSGFLFRGSVYLLIISAAVFVWPGITLGITF